jgi:phosphoglycolate phosphatase
MQDRLGDAYRDAYFAARTAAGAQPEPLYDGIVPMLDQLTADGWLLGIATGKSQRGLIRLLTAHGILDRFVTLQTADFHPSKPDPAMVHAALAETGCAAQSTVVIGDTSFDMAMARAAGAEALGVVWGYHDPAELSAHGARMVADQVADLPSLLLSLMERPA